LATIVDIYCRVSTDPQDDNTSHEEQERSAREYCRQNGLIVGMVHHETFSGFVYREREKLSLMRERYRNGKIQGVVVRTFDRLSRKQVHAAVLLDEMDHHDVTLHCVMEPVRSEDKAMEQFVRMVFAFIAEIEREKIMDRLMTGRTNAVKDGDMRAVSTHKLRYGYMWADAERTKIALSDVEAAPETTEADIVRWMAEQYAAGIAAFSIEQQLNGRGIPSPSGKEWRACTIIRILSDRRITGENAQVFVNKAKRYKTHHDTFDIPDGTYPAIISTELFEKIQRRMSQNKIKATRSSKHPEEFLLRAGYVRCSRCGWSMGAKTDAKHDTYIYRCRQHGSIVSKQLDAVIWQKVEELADHVTLIEQAIALATQDKKLEQDGKAIDASIERWQKSAANYLEDLKDPNLTGDSRAGIRNLLNEANQMVKKLQGEKAQIQAGLLDRAREQAAYQEILAWCKEVKEARGELSYQRKRDFLDMLGVVVTIIYPTRPNEGSTYDMRVRLPALQALIRLPEPEPCDAYTEV
jgi:site-specific DNA recombinase